MSNNFGSLCRDVIGSNVRIKGNKVIDEQCNGNFKRLKVNQIVTGSNPNQLPYPKGYMCGFKMIHLPDEDGLHEIVIESGACRDTDNRYNICTTDELSADFNVSGPNGLDETESGGASKWYAVFVIADRSEVLPVASFLSSSETPTLPSGYNSFRRIGWLKTSSQPGGSPHFNWGSAGGSSDFDTETVSFTPASNVSQLCFSSGGMSSGHSHGGTVNIKIELWNGSQWIIVFSEDTTDEILFDTISASFPTIPSVSQMRISSDPAQSETFHSMDYLDVYFECSVKIVPFIQKCTGKSRTYCWNTNIFTSGLRVLDGGSNEYWTPIHLSQAIPPNCCFAQFRVDMYADDDDDDAAFRPSGTLDPSVHSGVTSVCSTPTSMERQGSPINVQVSDSGEQRFIFEMCIGRDNSDCIGSPNQNIQSVDYAVVDNDIYLSVFVVGFTDEL